MSTPTIQPDAGNRLTVPINASIQVDLDDAEMIPAFPANLGTPRISWYLVSGGIETLVFLHKGGRRCLTFLTAPTAEGECKSAFQQDIGFGEKLTAKEQRAVAGWFEIVGALLFNAYKQIANAVTDSDGAAYRAVTAYATGTDVTEERRIQHSMADVLTKHQYRPGDRSCSCDENWYDSRADRSRDMEEHFVHVENELVAAGFGNTTEAG